jgi:hypothetical protein
MLRIKDDAVFVIINVGRILEEPSRIVDGNGNNAVILTGGGVDATGVALVFLTKGALGITALLHSLGGGNGLGVLFGLGQIDGDIDLAVLGVMLPFHVLGNTVAADIVAVTAELIIPVGRRNRIFAVKLLKNSNHLGGPWHEKAHDFRIKEIAIHNAVLTEPVLNGVVGNRLEDIAERLFTYLDRLLILVETEDFEKTVDRVNAITFLHQLIHNGIVDKFGNSGIHNDSK